LSARGASEKACSERESLVEGTDYILEECSVLTEDGFKAMMDATPQAVNMPVAGVPFKPRNAYKALVKMGVALLSDDELDNYRKPRAWLLEARPRYAGVYMCCSKIRTLA
jgi:hypothetical protein